MRENYGLVPLKLLAQLRMGGTPSRNEPSYWAHGQGGVPWVSISDIRDKFIEKTAETVTHEGIRAARLKYVAPGTPIMSFKLSLGRATIPRIPVLTNEAIVALDALEGRADSRWLYYAVPRVAERAITEVAVKGNTLNLNKLRNLLIPTPGSISEQRRIAEILDAIDDQIMAMTSRQRKLQTVLSAALDKAISDIVDDEGVILRELDEIAQVTSGVTLGSEPGVESSLELPYLRVANVQDGYIDTSEIKIVRVRRADVDRYLLHPGDLLLTEGGDLDKLGRGAVWDGRISECLHQNHIFRVRCKGDVTNPNYLAAYVGSRYGKSYFMSVAKQTTNLASINSTQVKRMPIPIVSTAVQQRVSDLLAEKESQTATGEREIRKLRSTKQALMNDLLTGGVPVPVEVRI